MPIRNRSIHRPTPQKKDLVGVDVFLDWWKGSFYGVANELGALGRSVNGDGLKLQTIANRGVKVYPGGFSDTFTVDHWRCRFVADAGEGSLISHAQLISLLAAIRCRRTGRDQDRESLQLRRGKRLLGIKRFRSL